MSSSLCNFLHFLWRHPVSSLNMIMYMNVISRRVALVQNYRFHNDWINSVVGGTHTDIWAHGQTEYNLEILELSGRTKSIHLHFTLCLLLKMRCLSFHHVADSHANCRFCIPASLLLLRRPSAVPGMTFKYFSLSQLPFGLCMHGLLSRKCCSLGRLTFGIWC